MSENLAVIDRKIVIEQEIIGNLLNDNKYFIECSNIKPFMFSNVNHQIIYKTVFNLLSKGESVDSAILANYMGKDEVRKIGGISYLFEITNWSDNIETFKAKLKILVDNYKEEKINDMCRKILGGDNKAEETIKAVEDTLAELYNSETETDIDVDKQYENFIDDIWSEDTEKGFNSGFSSLDEKFGNFQPGRLITIFARSGIGKSTVAIQMALNMALKKYRVIYGSGEMSKKEVFNKMAASYLNIEYQRLAKKILNEDTKLRVQNFIIRLNNSKFYITNETDIDKFINEVKLYKLKYGLDVLYVDYVNKYITSVKGQSLTERIGIVTGRLKDLALKEKICVVMLAQANRETDKKQGEAHMVDKITESDIQDSARIEQDSDQIIALYRNKNFDNLEYRTIMTREGKIDLNSKKAEKNPDVINMLIVKNRHGERATLTARWEGKYSRVKEILN